MFGLNPPLSPDAPAPGARPRPADTVAAARAAFPKGAPLLTLRDELGPVFSDDDIGSRS